MKYSKNTIIRRNNKHTILGNVNNGKWIRINNTLYDTFKQLLEQGGLGKVYKYSKTRELTKILTDINVLVENEEEEEKLKTLTFAITNKCNLECIHCGYSANPTEYNELNKELILSVISQLKNIENIGITGGEPLVHKDFCEIAEFIGKNVTGRKTLMTNATLINESNVDLIIKNFDDVAISLDASSERTCDEIRGHGVFKKVISVIKLLKSKNFKNISLSFVESEINKNEVRQFQKLCEEFEVEAILRNFLAVGRGSEHKNRLALDNGVIENRFDETIPLSEYRKHLTLATRCSAAVSSLYIQFNGDIYPCPVAGVDENLKMGNIKDISDLNSYISKRYEQVGFENYAKLSYDKVGNCNECEVKDFCWRCLQEYYDIFADGSAYSEECAFRKKNLMKIVWGD